MVFFQQFVFPLFYSEILKRSFIFVHKIPYYIVVLSMVYTRCQIIWLHLSSLACTFQEGVKKNAPGNHLSGAIRHVITYSLSDNLEFCSAVGSPTLLGAVVSHRQPHTVTLVLQAFGGNAFLDQIVIHSFRPVFRQAVVVLL